MNDSAFTGVRSGFGRNTIQAIIFGVMLSAASAADDNPLQTWISPNGRYAIKEQHYGQGQRVVAIFKNLSTGRTAIADDGGARGFDPLWSPDSHYVAIGFDRSHNWGDTRVFRVDRGRIFLVTLPSGMEANKFLPRQAEGQIMHLGPQGLLIGRWLSAHEIELIAETSGFLYREGDSPTHCTPFEVAQHFIVKLSGRSGTIVKSFAAKGGIEGRDAGDTPSP